MVISQVTQCGFFIMFIIKCIDFKFALILFLLFKQWHSVNHSSIHPHVKFYKVSGANIFHSRIKYLLYIISNVLFSAIWNVSSLCFLFVIIYLNLHYKYYRDDYFNISLKNLFHLYKNPKGKICVSLHKLYNNFIVIYKWGKLSLANYNNELIYVYCFNTFFLGNIPCVNCQLKLQNFAVILHNNIA